MRVDCSAVLYVGKQFEHKDEAEEFYKEHIKLTEEQLRELGDQGFVEWVEYCGVLDYKCLNHYVGNPECLLGFNIVGGLRKPEQFAESVSNAIAKWKELIPNIEPEIIHTVCIW